MKRKLNNLLPRQWQTCLYISFTILILLLTIINLQKLNRKEIKVLGAETNNSFWEDFMQKNPTYRDGWIELGRMDQVKQIDPNYQP